MNYNYEFLGGLNNSYVFVTDRFVVYEIKFKPSPYLLQTEKEIAGLVYEFVIEVAVNDTGKNPVLDYKVSNTIAVIFREFFNVNNHNICIYICDSSDDRQDIMRKKFDQWFYKYQDSSFIKLDEVLIDSDRNRYPISMIVLKNNPFIKQIIEAFINLSEGNQK